MPRKSKKTERKEPQQPAKEAGIAPGSAVHVGYQGAQLDGELMPTTESSAPNILVVKLDNGYNIGLDRAKATLTETAAPKRPVGMTTRPYKRDSSLPRVTLLYTGGTIGSKVDYKTGGVYMLTKPEELLAEVPELSGIADIDVKHLMSIASEDMNSDDWARIAEEAARSLNSGSRGIVITHGTDTMHYTSAALSFMLQGLNAPVLLTGSQRSSDRGSSDAFLNLISSTRMASGSDIAAVAICMHANSSDDTCSVLLGTKARKMHTSRRDAFRAINNRPIANIRADGAIRYIRKAYPRIRADGGEVKAMTRFDRGVAIAKSYPGSNPELIDFYLEKGYKGLIIEATGLGHTPVLEGKGRASWLPYIKNAVDNGMVIGITSQCIYGRVNPRVYRNLRLLAEAGAIYCEDMTTETALVKLGWLLGNYTKDEARAMLNRNLVGEIRERSLYDEFLI